MSKHKNCPFLIVLILVTSIFIFINLKETKASNLACQDFKDEGCECLPALSCDPNLLKYEKEGVGGCEEGLVCCCDSAAKLYRNQSKEKIPGLPEPVQSPTNVIPYEFETGIPGIAKKGETLKRMTLAEFVKLLIIYIFRISGILAFVMIVYGGILYLISGGDSKKQALAQKTISNAVIGLILLFAFWLILNTINPDILRAPKISIEGGNNGGNGGNSGGGGNLNIDQETIELAQKILNGTAHTEIEYDAAKKDLEDVINKNCTDPFTNSTIKKENCLDKVDFPDCPSINKNLLKGLSGIINKFEANYNQFSDCGKLKISPFISDHYYCDVPTSSHRFGCATDLALKDKECTQKLLKSLCNVRDEDLDKCENVFICTFSLNGAALGIVNETNCEGVEPHLHLQAINCP